MAGAAEFQALSPTDCAAYCTVKLTAPLVPLGAVTVTVRTPVGALFASIVKVADREVGLMTVTPVTFMPVAGLTETVVAFLTKFLPDRVTVTGVPRAPLLGVARFNTGAPTVALNVALADPAKAVNVWVKPVPR